MSASVLAVITGERGQREIVRPLAAVGVECAVLDWTTCGGSHLRWLAELRQQLDAQPRVVFTDMDSVFLAAQLVLAHRRGLRVFLRLRGDPLAEARDQLGFHLAQRQPGGAVRAVVNWALDKMLLPLVDLRVPVSRWIVERLQMPGRDAVVRIPCEIAAFPPRTHVENSRRILAVTNFNYPRKIAALGRFLAAHAAALHADGWTITVAGAGLALEQFRAAHGAHAVFPGFVSDVAALYATHDVFVHFSDLDAFPYTVLEAQAAGLPVVVNRDCGMLEQIEHDRTGLIVDLDDAPQLRAAIARLVVPAERARLGTAARAHVAAHYTHARLGRDLAGLL